jgi:hypothetical protein
MKAISEYRAWFEAYVKPFLEEKNAHIKEKHDMKRKHTYRVCALSKKIVQEEKLSPKQQYLAELIALFHDIGRFPQYKQYQTFDDKASIDHAALANATLKKYDILKTCTSEEQDIITTAIFYHNKNKEDIPANIPAETLIQLNVIRDADKLDNFTLKQFSTTGKMEAYNETILEDLSQGKASDPHLIKTNTDKILYYLSWLYDLNFTLSYQFLEQEHLIDDYLNHLQGEAFDPIKEQISMHMKKKLSSL